MENDNQRYLSEVQRDMDEDYEREATSTAMSCAALALAGIIFLVLGIISIFT